MAKSCIGRISLSSYNRCPQEFSGKITISAYAAQQSGEVVTVILTDDEEETYHGQQLTAQYLMTETCQRQDGIWKLLLVHAYSVLKEPESVVLFAADLDAYAAAPDLIYTIKRETDHLIAEREGRPKIVPKAEVRDVFFVSGQMRTRKIFERDHTGRVTAFVDRREGSDLVWATQSGPDAEGVPRTLTHLATATFTA